MLEVEEGEGEDMVAALRARRGAQCRQMQFLVAAQDGLLKGLVEVRGAGEVGEVYTVLHRLLHRSKHCIILYTCSSVFWYARSLFFFNHFSNVTPPHLPSPPSSLALPLALPLSLPLPSPSPSPFSLSFLPPGRSRSFRRRRVEAALYAVPRVGRLRQCREPGRAQ